MCPSNNVNTYETEKSAFLNSSRLKSVFENLRFRDGLAWMVGPKRRNKAVFSNFRPSTSVDAALEKQNYYFLRTSTFMKLKERHYFPFSGCA